MFVNMWKDKSPLRHCGRITAIVILLNFLMTFPVYGEPLTEHLQNSYKNEMKLYSDYEIEILIDDITEAALEAIEQAAGEAAKAAALAMLEREAAALREAQRWRLEAEIQQQALKEAKAAGRKNTLLAALIGLLGGLALGVGGTLIIRGR